MKISLVLTVGHFVNAVLAQEIIVAQCGSQVQNFTNCYAVNALSCGVSCPESAAGNAIPVEVNCEETVQAYCDLLSGCCDQCIEQSAALRDCVYSQPSFTCDKKSCDGGSEPAPPNEGGTLEPSVSPPSTTLAPSEESDQDFVTEQCNESIVSLSACISSNCLTKCGLDDLTAAVTPGGSCEDSVDKFCAISGCCSSCAVEAQATRACLHSVQELTCDDTCPEIEASDPSSPPVVSDPLDCLTEAVTLDKCENENGQPCSSCETERFEAVFSCNDINSLVATLKSGCCGSCQKPASDYLGCMTGANKCEDEESAVSKQSSGSMAQSIVIVLLVIVLV